MGAERSYAILSDARAKHSRPSIGCISGARVYSEAPAPRGGAKLRGALQRASFRQLPAAIAALRALPRFNWPAMTSPRVFERTMSLRSAPGFTELTVAV